jgi:hypothetical protein
VAAYIVEVGQSAVVVGTGQQLGLIVAVGYHSLCTVVVAGLGIDYCTAVVVVVVVENDIAVVD